MSYIVRLELSDEAAEEYLKTGKGTFTKDDVTSIEKRKRPNMRTYWTHTTPDGKLHRSGYNHPGTVYAFVTRNYKDDPEMYHVRFTAIPSYYNWLAKEHDGSPNPRFIGKYEAVKMELPIKMKKGEPK